MLKPDSSPSPDRTGETLPKAPTGIPGLDEITGGGLPRGRPTLICGGAGCGKTLFAVEFLLRGAVEFGEPGVFMAFEETAEELAQNVRSLGFDLDDLVAAGKISVDYVHVERGEIEESGEFDLEGIFVRLALAIDSVGAKRVVLDTIEALFGGFSNPIILRAELRRLFRWLKNRGVTAVITGERGEGTLTRQGLEEYVSDCVILLDHRVGEQVSTRRLRIVKYRGSTHGTNEYPFLIGEDGISVIPLSSAGLAHPASTERISSGIPGLDAMLGDEGFYRGSSILVLGMAGTGKSSVAAHFVEAACMRGERCLYLAFEESPQQICRNMRSIGVDLEPWIKEGLLEIEASRPTEFGLERHLLEVHGLVAAFDPAVLVMDPVADFSSTGARADAEMMLLRIVDFLKMKGITAMFCQLGHGVEELGQAALTMSSLIDTCIVLSNVQNGARRERTLSILKSRGMEHSNEIRELRITPSGIDLGEPRPDAGSSGAKPSRKQQRTGRRPRLARENGRSNGRPARGGRPKPRRAADR